MFGLMSVLSINCFICFLPFSSTLLLLFPPPSFVLFPSLISFLFSSIQEGRLSKDRLQLQLAEAKGALLAADLLLWTSARLSDIRCLVVNWDVQATPDASGVVRVFVNPVHDKTQWRQTTAQQIGDVGKVMHSSLQSLYEDWLLRHRPIIVANLGYRAKHDITFSDAKHGPGASICSTLFPVFWDASQRHTFSVKMFEAVLGCTERTIRRLQSKAFGAHREEWGLQAEAVNQQLHHSADVDKLYKQGLRNTLNDMQAWLYKWA